LKLTAHRRREATDLLWSEAAMSVVELRRRDAKVKQQTGGLETPSTEHGSKLAKRSVVDGEP
jgi:hypothetical protein